MRTSLELRAAILRRIRRFGLVPLHRGFDWLAAKSETTATGLANPLIARRKRNSFFVRGIRILEGAFFSKRLGHAYPVAADGVGTNYIRCGYLVSPARENAV